MSVGWGGATAECPWGGALPVLLKEHAKIDRELVICGAGSHIEIWAKDVYDEYFKDEDENFDEMFNILGI